MPYTVMTALIIACLRRGIKQATKLLPYLCRCQIATNFQSSFAGRAENFATKVSSQISRHRKTQQLSLDVRLLPCEILVSTTAPTESTTSLLFLRVTCPCSLRTYATLKFIRSSSSSSSPQQQSKRIVYIMHTRQCVHLAA